ncbi:DNA-binding transcriptional ArsR family regulator [Microbacterium sp. AK009]|uniref:ArsR/SmtB family transcription factor n=1 Tax=Microbacterium sp. AK009 TaxID=2723068 RepID=UPI0015CDB9F9|nr:ArsR family transcriptional regulator [Microbacterium sp. AK009]NYF16645.1 DNA-binding transcriptional ArsR family regulator [Microbacterium sp. AK009]
MSDEVTSEERLQEIFVALGSVKRLLILRLLAEAVTGRTRSLAAGLTISEVATAVEITRFAASHHLKILRAAGVVKATRDRQSLRHELEINTFLSIDEWLLPLLQSVETQVER